MIMPKSSDALIRAVSDATKIRIAYVDVTDWSLASYLHFDSVGKWTHFGLASSAPETDIIEEHEEDLSESFRFEWGS